MKVFFYGLFMDTHLLAGKGIIPRNTAVGHVKDFRLRIGARATLLRAADARAYGVVMEISPAESKALYAESSVADYVPETVAVELTDGSIAEAECYILPGDKVTGANADYAQALLKVARKLDLPEAYLAEIAGARD